MLQTLRSKVIMFAVLAVLFAAGCSFFTYYTVRLAYVNLTVADIGRHRQAGMYVGAVVFPVAALAFGYLSFWCVKAIGRCRGGTS